MLIIKKINNFIIYFLIAASAVFLLFNKYPYFQVLSILLLLVIAFIFFLLKFSFVHNNRDILFVLMVIYLYFIISYFISGQTLQNFLSYRFLRYDGNFFFCYIMFFVFSIPFFDYKKALSIYFKFAFFTFTALSLLGLTEYMFEKTAITIQKEPYAGKIFHAFNVTHNATGSVYSMICIFALVFFLREKNIYKKTGYIFVLASCIIGLLITKSRGSYVGLAAAFIFILWMNYRSIKKFLISLAIISAASLPFLYITGAYKRIFQIFDFKATTTIRLDLWERAWSLFSQSPIFGVGFGRYNDIFENSRLQGIRGLVNIYIDPNFAINDAHAHNAYFQFLSETGVIGLFLLLLFWFLCFYKINRAFINTENEFSKKVYLCGLGAIISLLTISFTENYMSATTVMVCVSIIVALCLGLIWQNDKEKLHNRIKDNGHNLENENN